MDVEKKDNAELILMVITIGSHWSPLELEKTDKVELIQMVIDIGAPLVFVILDSVVLSFIWIRKQ